MQVWSRIEWQVGNVARTRVSEYWHRVRRLTGVSTRADLCSSRVSESCVHLESLHFKTGAVFSTDYLERVNETRAWGRVHCHVWRRRTKASVVDNRKGFFFFPSQLWLDTRQGPHLTWKKSLPAASGLGNQTRGGGRVIGLGLSPKKTLFLTFPKGHLW